MDDYEGFHDMDTPEQSGAEGETPVNMNAAAPADTPAETPAEAAPAANPAEPAYYELPPERRGACFQSARTNALSSPLPALSSCQQSSPSPLR